MEEKPYIPTYLTQAILSTIFCCVPLGLIAIIFSAQVNTKLQESDISGAEQSSRNAKKSCWISFIAGLVICIIWSILYFLFGFAFIKKGFGKI